MRVCPITWRQAEAFVKAQHRHHGAPAGCKFAIGLRDATNQLRGVILAGRPVARMLDDGYTLEVTRCCTDGVVNGCSMLYRAVWGAARAMGYRSVITYTLESEGGSSLRGAGFTRVGAAGGGSWSRPSRPREDKAPTVPKQLWRLVAA